MSRADIPARLLPPGMTHSGSAPAARSAATTPASPRSTASCSGVQPAAFMLFTAAAPPPCASGMLLFRIRARIPGVGDPWLFGADPDPRIRTSDKWIRIRLRIFSDFKDAKIFFFSIFSFLELNHRHIIFSFNNLIFLLKFCVQILFCKHYFTSEPLPNGSGSRSWRPKNMRIPDTAGYGSQPMVN